MSEAQRVTTLAFSGVPGGDDSNPAVVELKAGALHDIGRNDNVDQFGIALTESPDVIIPELLNVSVNLRDGIIIFTPSETLDTDMAQFLLTKISIADISKDDAVPLQGATALNTADEGVTVTVTLTELQRVAIIPSPTPVVAMVQPLSWTWRRER